VTGAEIAARLRAEGCGVLAMVVEARGSTPRAAGAAMFVGATETVGTIGGGRVEFECVAAARGMLDEEVRSASPSRPVGTTGPRPTAPQETIMGGRDAPPRGRARPSEQSGTVDGGSIRDFPLGPALDQCCGGFLRIALAPLTVTDAPRFETGESALWDGGPVWREVPAPRAVLIYGAGHVGRALIRALAPLPFALRWVDARPGATEAAPPGVATIETPLPEAEAAAAPPGAFHMILTHSHALDLEIAAAALGARPAHVGLIGSATKRATFARKLRDRGLDPAGLTCPIGLPGFRDKRPAVIAASVAADLLQRDAALAAAEGRAA
jgi:xanthine dehydrogenase accessory protein XdhC